MSDASLKMLNARISSCALCPRLAAYIRQVGREKVKRFADQEYWARPLSGWGDPRARLLIVGLAPAAHGGNRTGRMFTGDSSGDWLMKAMHETGFATSPASTSRDDGLALKDAYITAALRCAPPGNKPAADELANCLPFLSAELAVLKKVRVVLALGAIAFGSFCRAEKIRPGPFGHGLRYALPAGRTLVASYHPSRQNTNTGRLTWEMWIGVFRAVRALLDG